MSKRIRIKEEGENKNFTASKLKTNLQGGGTCLWVPQDEAGDYANLSNKTITANGTYNASSDNVDGFSKVTVNVPPQSATLISKNISANGTYNASSDNADGYSSVVVSVQPNLGDKNITANGTYDASTDGKQGFWRVVVNVPSVDEEEIYAELLARSWGTAQDLTGTTWHFYDTVTLNSEGAFSINFTDIGGESHTAISLGSTDIFYNGLTVYSPATARGESWNYRGTGLKYQTVTFTGGADINNATFISWLRNNAKRVDLITNLTGTTWELKSERLVALPQYSESGNYSRFYNLNITSNSNNFSGANWYNYDPYSSRDYDSGAMVYGATTVYSGGHWENNAYRTISITGGTSATDVNIINWLYSNAERVV